MIAGLHQLIYWDREVTRIVERPAVVLAPYRLAGRWPERHGHSFEPKSGLKDWSYSNLGKTTQAKNNFMAEPPTGRPHGLDR